MYKRVLVVTKDTMDFLMYHRIMQELASGGVIANTADCGIVAEGVSMAKWINAGYEIYGGFPKKGEYDEATLCRHDLDPYQVLQEEKPHLVLVGLSFWPNLGPKFALAAKELGIPLGFVEDIWMAHRRSVVVPDFICTLDRLGSGFVEDNDIYDRTKVFITGNPAWDALSEIKPDPFIKQITSASKRVVLMAGQDLETTSMVEGLLEALDEQGEYILFPKIHPAWRGLTRENVRAERDQRKREEMEVIFEACQLWRDKLANPKNGCVIWTDTGIHQLMLSSRYIVSISSNALIEAALLGKVPVSWNSDLGRQSMRAGFGGLENFPLVDLKCAVEVESPDDFLFRVPEYGFAVHACMRQIQREIYSKKRNTKRVVRIIKDFLK